MRQLFASGSWFVVPRVRFVICCAWMMLVASTMLQPIARCQEQGPGNQEQPYRPEAGKFPLLEKAHSYRGVLAFVDHANRRGSLRVETPGEFFRNAPHPFAMLPYGMVRFHGAPADLRDIPLGTVLHVRAFLPPDPKTSSVPVLQKGNPERPAENHVLLLEDEPSFCLREGLVWKLKEVEVQANQGLIAATREPKADGDGKANVEKLTFNAATRFWRGRECLSIDDLITDGIWPASGKKTLDHNKWGNS